MSSLSSSDLERIKSGLESGKPIPASLKELGIDARPVEVREQLFEAYGRDEVMGIIREKVMPGRGAGAGFPLQRMVQRLLSRPDVTADQIDALVARLQDAIVQLNAKKSELEQ